MPLKKEFSDLRLSFEPLTLYQKFEQVCVLMLTTLIAIIIALALWNLTLKILLSIWATNFDPTDYGVFQTVFGMIFIQDARYFFAKVNAKTPWWKEVPWIWQLDAEKFNTMPRAPSPAEAKAFLDELRRLAGGKGYFIAYAPRWVYGDRFAIGYDLWASNYNGSGAPRNFKQQYKGVPASSWRAYSGRKPRILQFASRMGEAGQWLR